MKCEKCRRVNQAGSKFCDKCGQPLQPALRLEKEPVVIKSASSKKGLWLGLSTIVLLLMAIAVALFLTMPNYNELQKALDDVQSGEDFYQLLTVEGVSDAEQKAQQAFWQQRSAVPAVKMALTALRNSDSDSVVVRDEPLQVERTKKFGLFDYYRITPIAVVVEATTNVPAVTLTLQDQTTALTANETTAVGKLLPGSYDYQVVWDSPFGKVEETRTFTTDNKDINADFDFYTVTLAGEKGRELNYFVNDAPLDAALLIDGELIVPQQQSFSLHTTFEEGGVTYTSDKLEIKDGAHEIKFVYPTYKNVAQVEKVAKAPVAPVYKDLVQIENATTMTIVRYLNLYTSGEANRLGEVISADSAFLGSQTKYLAGLNEQGITLGMMSYKVLSFTDIGNNTYRLLLNETFVVNEPGKDSRVVKQSATYDVTDFNGNFLITNYQFKN